MQINMKRFSQSRVHFKNIRYWTVESDSLLTRAYAKPTKTLSFGELMQNVQKERQIPFKLLRSISKLVTQNSEHIPLMSFSSLSEIVKKRWRQPLVKRSYFKLGNWNLKNLKKFIFSHHLLLEQLTLSYQYFTQSTVFIAFRVWITI